MTGGVNRGGRNPVRSLQRFETDDGATECDNLPGRNVTDSSATDSAAQAIESSRLRTPRVPAVPDEPGHEGEQAGLDDLGARRFEAPASTATPRPLEKAGILSAARHLSLLERRDFLTLASVRLEHSSRARK